MDFLKTFPWITLGKFLLSFVRVFQEISPKDTLKIPPRIPSVIFPNMQKLLQKLMLAFRDSCEIQP